jgi:hypothetical protein
MQQLGVRVPGRVGDARCVSAAAAPDRYFHNQPVARGDVCAGNERQARNRRRMGGDLLHEPRGRRAGGARGQDKAVDDRRRDPGDGEPANQPRSVFRALNEGSTARPDPPLRRGEAVAFQPGSFPPKSPPTMRRGSK